MTIDSQTAESSEPTVFLPVVCPTCNLGSISEFPIKVVVIALTRWHQMALYAHCHEQAWNASPVDLHRIRRYLGESWLDSNEVV